MSYSKVDPKLISNPASLILIGEISHSLRARGRADATGLVPDNSPSSPIIDGKYIQVTQPQVGIMDYASFADSLDGFLDNNSDRSAWNLVGAVSLDAIFCPYNNFTDPNRSGPYMPHWTMPEDVNETVTSITLNPFNPFNQLASLSSYGSGNLSNDAWMSGGHSVQFALSYNPKDPAFTSNTGVYPGGTGSPVDFYFEKDHFARWTVEKEGIRGVGFKAPMVLTGWGYDIEGNPVPSSPTSSTTFHPQASWNSNLWKSGPVDLRWDERRGVWTGGNTTKVYLVKLTNLYTPPSFSFEVDRSNGRDQYTRNAPQTARVFNSSENLYDPEYIAYSNNPTANQGYYEQLDYTSIEFPYYEAFIIRETVNNPVANVFYNIWTQDCQDCGHITEPCGGGHNTSSERKKILIENPLRQSFDVGDLAFTVFTGRKQRVNTGNFIGGSGTGATASIYTDESGNAYFNVISEGSNYTTGGFAISTSNCDICTNILLQFSDGVLTTGILNPSGGFPINKVCNLTIYPNNAIIETEELPIHWVIQSEFKSQQVVTHVECDNGILQSCTMKIQTQGYKTCEWCGEETALINN